MKSNQKMLLIIIIVILVITSIVAVVLSLNNNNDNTDNGGGNYEEPTPEYPQTISTEIELLTKEDVFFGVQEAINTYFTYLISDDNLHVFHLLLDEFRESNNLTTSDAATKLKRFHYTPTYVAEKIYYNPRSSVTYYFVSGYVLDTPVEEGTIEYYPHINFLVVVDDNNKYILEPLEDNLDMETFAKNYNIGEMTANNEEVFKPKSLSVKNKVTYYVSLFQDLLYLDSTKAFNMLYGQAKEFFTDYMRDDGYDEPLFLQYRDTIYIGLAKTYNNLKTATEDDGKVYSEYTDDGNIISVKENSVMDFKIDFDFGW